jgi:hypothetical protein
MMDATCEHRGAPRKIVLDNEARSQFLAFRESNERSLAPDGQLAGLREWGSKLPGKVLRMAALIEIAMDGLEVTRVSAASLRTAWRIADLLVPHARAVFYGLGASHQQAGARALLEWVRAYPWPGNVLLFSQRDAHRALEHRFRTSKELAAAAAVLTGWGVLSAPLTNKPKTGRPSVMYAVNPDALQ